MVKAEGCPHVPVKRPDKASEGLTVLGFTTAAAAAHAVAGDASFDALLRIQALTRVYDDFVHLVAQDSNIEEVTDIRGRSVTWADRGRGTGVIAEPFAEALAASRSHSMGDDGLSLEDDPDHEVHWPDETLAGLIALDYALTAERGTSYGRVHAVQYNVDTQMFTGVADPRREGRSAWPWPWARSLRETAMNERTGR